MTHRRLLAAVVAGLVLCALAVALLVPGSPAADAEGDALPVLPPAAERFPDRYDDQGCLRVGPAEDEVACEASAADLDEALAGDSVTDVRSLEGFSGAGWTEDLTTGRVRVLTGTVHATSDGEDGGWRALGLARNETTSTLGSIAVTATLVDGAGSVLAEVDATAPVRVVRPGEPVPFVVDAPVPADAVARVEWRADGGPTVEAGDERAAGWQPYYELPAGDREPVAMYLHTDPTDGPLPHLVFGSVANLGATDLEAPVVVVALRDDDGRVVAVREAPVSDPGGSPAAALAPGAAGDAAVATPGAPASVTTTVWVTPG